MGELLDGVRRRLEADGVLCRGDAEGEILWWPVCGEVGRWAISVGEPFPEVLAVFGHVPILAPRARRGAVAEAISRANWDLVIGNFEMDPSDGEIRFRASTRFERATLDDEGAFAEALTERFAAVCANVQTYLPAFAAVIFGGRSPAAAIARAEADSMAIGDSCTSGSTPSDENPGAERESDDATLGFGSDGLGTAMAGISDAAFGPMPEAPRRASAVSEPRQRLEDLILTPELEARVAETIAFVKHRDVAFEKWGLGKLLPYGRGLTILFHGPPGTGKTALAEAVASACGMKILRASYAEIQNRFVGETEKAIVRTFRQAEKAGALLFWDECDAMFFDRALAHAAWESRDVNVLLTEIERFEGVTVLATNRADMLDPALDRRIAMKVEIGRPDRATRAAIWRAALACGVPLGDGVDPDTLAESDLSPAEIKSALMGAARTALRRGVEAHVTIADLAAAITARQATARRAPVLGFGTGQRGKAPARRARSSRTVTP